ncbi:MAG: pre-peptidase C-terminal domain-containing protein, partial [Phycisphaerae bacterium]|nr:pre-peptidase C-terminal domain-containing protein [Phycisphaerae bacterium]
MSIAGRVMAIVLAAGFVGGLVFLPGAAVGAQVAESGPNGTAATANALLYGDYGAAAITPVGDYDFWVVSNLAVGDLVFVYVDTQSSTTMWNSWLCVVDNDGTTLIESDLSDGPDSGSVVAGAVVATAGDVYYRVNESGDDQTITPYEIYQAVLNPTDTAAEAEPNDAVGTNATPISAGVMTAEVTGSDIDFFSFSAAGGDSMVVIMDDDPDDDHDLTDTELDILDTDGLTVLAGGDDDDAHNGNAAGAVDAPVTGTYFVRVSAGSSSADTDYRFTVLVNGVPVNGAGPLGACCFVGGGCTMLLEGDCTATGGNYQGWGSDCASTACPLPTGACCAADGSCTEVTEADCTAAGGTYQGNTSTCATHPCPQPTGACCAADGSCTDVTEAACTAAGGTYQ